MPYDRTGRQAGFEHDQHSQCSTNEGAFPEKNEGAVNMGVMSLVNQSPYRDREKVGLNKTMIFTSLQVHIFSLFRWVC